MLGSAPGTHAAGKNLKEPREFSFDPKPGWFEDRRKLIVWEPDHRDPEVTEYVATYWEVQATFRAASEKWRRQDNKATRRFPRYTHLPGFRRRSRPLSHMEQSSA